jgi:membrane dipeptidase
MIVDAHLDLADNALDLKRDLTLSLATLRELDIHADIPVVTLPALREGGVGLVFGTLWNDPARYTTPQSAHQHALDQLEVYVGWEEAGLIRIVRSCADLNAHLALWPQDNITGLVVLMESGDPIKEPSQASFWHSQGVRIIGPAWKRTRYCGGTREPGGLTPLGVELLQAMDACGLALDFSHMDEEAFWQAIDVFKGPVCATHANPRILLGGDGLEYSNRHLSDAMLQAIGARGGMVGTVLFNFFLDHTWTRGMPRVTLDTVAKHMQHVAGLIGWDKLGIGSDFDGGFGKNENPLGIDSPADLASLLAVLPKEAQAGVGGKNWLGWLERAL